MLKFRLCIVSKDHISMNKRDNFIKFAGEETCLVLVLIRAASLRRYSIFKVEKYEKKFKCALLIGGLVNQIKIKFVVKKVLKKEGVHNLIARPNPPLTRCSLMDCPINIGTISMDVPMVYFKSSSFVYRVFWPSSRMSSK